jgi:hypothetical protein
VQNEIAFGTNVPPLSLNTGMITTGNGKTYDLSNSASRQAMMDDNLVYFIDQVRNAIVKVDPTALVTASFPTPGNQYSTALGLTIRTYPAICVLNRRLYRPTSISRPWDHFSAD